MQNLIRLNQILFALFRFFPAVIVYLAVLVTSFVAHWHAFYS